MIKAESIGVELHTHTHTHTHTHAGAEESQIITHWLLALAPHLKPVRYQTGLQVC